MSVAIPAEILTTILTRLAQLFLAASNGNDDAARAAAAQILETYNPATLHEYRLAAQIIAFGFQSLEALAQSADRELPLTRILRLRSGAVSLSRESDRAQRRLDQLQQARAQDRQPAPAAIQQAEQPSPKAEKAAALTTETMTISAYAKANNLTWTQAMQQRERAKRIAANLAKNAAAASPSAPLRA